MIKKDRIISAIPFVLSAALFLAGCNSVNRDSEPLDSQRPTAAALYTEQGAGGAGETAPAGETTEGIAAGSGTSDAAAPDAAAAGAETPQAAEIYETDWSGYFDGLNGAAVFYAPFENKYVIYNQELADTRRSPCSTFKIVSSLIGLEEGIISRENSVRKWSGEIFWNEKWNQDIDFQEAFAASCVWYFREVVDEIGPERMQDELNKLAYGNCDISDWSGSINTNNNNPALTGFWVESSLKISPKEQTEVMRRIFEGVQPYKEETITELKRAMLVKDQDLSKNPIYGKTGLGVTEGITVDAWFTGYVETKEGNVYFCVYLGRTDGMEVSSSIAKDIAIQIASDHYN